ncbi:MAG: hypothetical protein Q9161_001138 [Pseudevernia consocians]
MSEKANHFEIVNTPYRSPSHLFDLLQTAAETSTATITVYPLGETKTPITKSYQEILRQAQKNARSLLQIKGITQQSKLLLHLDQHLENIVWFWSAIAAGLLPAMSASFVSDKRARRKHLNHLQELLKNPVILTRAKLEPEFLGIDELDIHCIESLGCFPIETSNNHGNACPVRKDRDKHHTAVLMLTSGSTGNAKAVGLSHEQLISSMNGKREVNRTTSKDVFLNWIGLDHVAGLSEVHFHATSAGAEQIHVQAADLLRDPLRFLDLVHKHRVTYTFAPNFFLALLRRSLDTIGFTAQNRDLDLSCLRIIQTGGEATVVKTCRTLSEQLQQLGVPRGRNVIRPGFGMTETCAGSIYHKDCPTYDLKHNFEFTALGVCMPGIQMRIFTDNGNRADTDKVGDLQITGPVVFSGYFNNPQASLDAFTDDGWFNTGDRARIDGNGFLNLVGRLKETIIINGVKYSPHELEIALEKALIPGVTPSYTIVFPHRPQDSETESFCVTYLPESTTPTDEHRTETADAIIKVCGIVFGVKPYQILPLERAHLPKTSLGKISRAKVRTAFESGAFADIQSDYNNAIRKHRMQMARHEEPTTDLEKQLVQIFATHFLLTAEEVGINNSVYDLGITSVELIGYQKTLEEHLNLNVEIQLSVILSNPTIKSLATTLGASATEPVYNPVVAMQPRGDKTPLWLIHPGVGEVLVFLNLSKYLTDRPVYALRARGFNKGESFFTSLGEIITTYHDSIKKSQPNGPYAIAGYSFGAMIAFEIGKMLEAEGDEVRFLGSFNLPPHIKARMRQLDWVQALLNLSYFLDLITESYAEEISQSLDKDDNNNNNNNNNKNEALSSSSSSSSNTCNAILDTIMRTASPTRLSSLSLTRSKLFSWTSLAHAMQQAALNYEPSGSVSCIDVFVAVPLVGIAKSKEEWYREHLCKWEDFSRNGVRFHDVEGEHYTMMGGKYVGGFQERLRGALEGRGV